MPAVCRVGDIGVGVCYGHDGPKSYVTTFIDGSPTVFTNGKQTCIVTTIGTASCGHTTIAVTGSPDVYATGQPVHRVGDTGRSVASGPYTATTGSPDTFAN